MLCLGVYCSKDTIKRHESLAPGPDAADIINSNTVTGILKKKKNPVTSYSVSIAIFAAI